MEPAIGNNVVAGHYHPTVLYNVDGVPGYRMWNWDRGTDMDYYTSTDGISWTLVPAGEIQPNNHAGPAFENPAAPVYDICILYIGSTSYGWVNNNGHWYLMTSNDALSWTNTGQCTLDISNDPNLDFSTDGRAWITLRNGVYEMWYSSDADGNFDGNRRDGISYAESADGLSFIAVNTLPGKGTAASPSGPVTNAVLQIGDGLSWRDRYTYTPTVLYDASMFSGHGEAREYKMYFVGRSYDAVTYPRRGIGYLSFDRPCGE